MASLRVHQPTVRCGPGARQEPEAGSMGRVRSGTAKRMRIGELNLGSADCWIRESGNQGIRESASDSN